MTLFRVCKNVTDCAGSFSYSAFYSAFCIYAFCAQVHAYKVSLKAFPNAGVAIYVMYEIPRNSLDLSEILCLYKAQERTPSTRSLG